MPENTLSRRTLAKTAAWSVPVVAVAVAAPLAAASTGVVVDIVVAKSCSTIALFGSAPTFTMSAATGVIPAGTTFTLAGASLANVLLTSTAASVSVVSGGVATITIGADTPSATVNFVGVTGVVLLGNFTLSLASLPAGYSQTVTSNDSATLRFSGLGNPVTGYVGTCNVLPIAV